ncbi:MAG: CheR family methyltransferase [bacterium]
MSFTKKNIVQEDLRLVREYLETQCGIYIEDNKDYLIENRLMVLAMKNNCSSLKELIFQAKHDPQSRLGDKIIDAMTTNETLWFRDYKPWIILKEILLPQLISALIQKRKQKIRVWSAACSTGQEPYSLAILIDEAIRENREVNWDHFEILGTDISPTALSVARSGSYDKIAISRGMINGYRQNYFLQQGTKWILNDEIRGQVRFKTLNLKHNFSHLGKFDVILCRNVTIYFSHTFKKQVIERLANNLQVDGTLFIGSTESLIGITDRFTPVHYEGVTYYKIKI